MTKSAKKVAQARLQRPDSAAKPPTPSKKKTAKPNPAAFGVLSPAAKATRSAGTSKPSKPDVRTKQARVLSMLRSHAGVTITAMMEATGWQQHSVRGFLAGVVRKRLKLNLASKKIDGTRVYQIASGGDPTAHSRQPKRPAA